jgi:hypothetical protein
MRAQGYWLALPGVMLLAACSTAPAPRTDLGTAQTLVSQAEQGQAASGDPADLAAARSELQQAQARAQSDRAAAAQLAGEAAVDARLAIARTRAAQEREALRQATASVTALRRQLVGAQAGQPLGALGAGQPLTAPVLAPSAEAVPVPTPPAAGGDTGGPPP